MSSSDIVRRLAAMPAKVISDGSIVTYDTPRRLPSSEGCSIVGLPCPVEILSLRVMGCDRAGCLLGVMHTSVYSSPVIQAAARLSGSQVPHCIGSHRNRCANQAGNQRTNSPSEKVDKQRIHTNSQPHPCQSALYPQCHRCRTPMMEDYVEHHPQR